MCSNKNQMSREHALTANFRSMVFLDQQLLTICCHQIKQKYIINFWSLFPAFSVTVDSETADDLTDQVHDLTLSSSVSSFSHSGSGDSSILGEAALGDGLHSVYLTAMPRRKRQSPTQDDDMDFWGRQSNKKARPSSNSSRKRDGESAFSSKRCIAWFTEYTDAEAPDMLGPLGMEKFCEDFGVEPENIVMLCLAYKLGAKQMGFFSKAEWLKGMTELQCDSMSKLQQKLDYLRSMLDDPQTFKAIYRYAFDFAREKEERTIDMVTAKAMLALLLGKNWSLFSHFHQFLEHSKLQVLNKDQWSNVLEFSRHILPDLTNYDEDGAWPVLLDDFVEWHREQYPDLHKSTSDTASMQTQTSSMHYC